MSEVEKIEPGEKSFSETQSLKIKDSLEKEKKSEVYKKFINIFSDGELIDVKKKE